MDYPVSVPGVGLVGGKFVDEDAAVGQMGSLIPAAWGNAVTDEVLAVLSANAIAPDEADNGQLAKAIQRGAMNVAAAGGTANAITASLNPAVTTLTNGLTVLVRASAANTTTTPTLALNGLAAKTIVKGNGLPLVAGDIAGAGHWIELQYDATLDKWALQNPATGIAATPRQIGNQDAGASSSGVVRVLFPDGGLYSGGSAAVGAIKIALPVGSWSYNSMIRLRVEIFDYALGESISLLIAGYLQTNHAWSNEAVTIIGQQADRDFTVRFGNDGTTGCVWIAETNSTWGYPKVSISEVMVGYNVDGGTVDRWIKGWSVSVVQAFDTVEDTLTGNLVFGQSAIANVAGLSAALAGKADASAAVPVGAVVYFTNPVSPAGFLSANGAAVSRTAYANLFAVIGTSFGAGDGASTFNLPDLRGEFIRGWDDGKGSDPSRAFGTLQLDALQGHAHRMNYEHGSESSSGATTNADGFLQLSADATLGASDNTAAIREPISNSGFGAPRFGAETRPRNVALLACIKY